MKRSRFSEEQIVGKAYDLRLRGPHRKARIKFSMRLWPSDKRDWLLVLFVAPLPLWMPVALLLIIGTQGAHSAGEAVPVEIVIAAVTVTLFLLAIFGVWRIGLGRRRS
jgi:hypothetical protein